MILNRFVLNQILMQQELDRRGIRTTPQQTEAIMYAVKDYAIDNKRILTDAEFEKIVNAVMARVSAAA